MIEEQFFYCTAEHVLPSPVGIQQYWKQNIDQNPVKLLFPKQKEV